MAWALTASNVDADVDVVFEENSTIGQKMYIFVSRLQSPAPTLSHHCTHISVTSLNSHTRNRVACSFHIAAKCRTRSSRRSSASSARTPFSRTKFRVSIWTSASPSFSGSSKRWSKRASSRATWCVIESFRVVLLTVHHAGDGCLTRQLLYLHHLHLHRTPAPRPSLRLTAGASILSVAIRQALCQVPARGAAGRGARLLRGGGRGLRTQAQVPQAGVFEFLRGLACTRTDVSVKV